MIITCESQPTLLISLNILNSSFLRRRKKAEGDNVTQKNDFICRSGAFLCRARIEISEEIFFLRF